MVLAARDSNWCWPFALVSSALWAYQVWVAYGLLFDAALNGFYAVMALVGLWRWGSASRGGHGTAREDAAGRPAGELPITTMSGREHFAWIACGAAVTGALVVAARVYTEAAMPLADATTTVYSVIGTVLLIERRLENWLYLLAMDAVYVWLYLERGSPLFAGLFALYCVLAAYGYWSWRRMAGARSGAAATAG